MHYKGLTRECSTVNSKQDMSFLGEWAVRDITGPLNILQILFNTFTVEFIFTVVIISML